MWIRHSRLLIVLSIFTACVPVLCIADSHTLDYDGWIDTPTVRIQTLALVQTLNSNLLSGNSATKTLLAWCLDHRISDAERIKAEVVRKDSNSANVPMEVRVALGALNGEQIAFRQVKLFCGPKVLSEADNWYLPDRLTPSMNNSLNNSDTPFGAAVSELGFYRKIKSVEWNWEILPSDWYREPVYEAKTRNALSVPEVLLQHRAVLLTSSNIPFSYVVERYTKNVLSFPLGK